MKITYWSDYACPYCYIGEERLMKAIESIPEMKNVQLEMKAFRLDPSAGEHAVSDTQHVLLINTESHLRLPEGKLKTSLRWELLRDLISGTPLHFLQIQWMHIA